LTGDTVREAGSEEVKELRAENEDLKRRRRLNQKMALMERTN